MTVYTIENKRSQNANVINENTERTNIDALQYKSKSSNNDLAFRDVCAIAIRLAS